MASVVLRLSCKSLTREFIPSKSDFLLSPGWITIETLRSIFPFLEIMEIISQYLRQQYFHNHRDRHDPWPRPRVHYSLGKVSVVFDSKHGRCILGGYPKEPLMTSMICVDSKLKRRVLKSDVCSWCFSNTAIRFNDVYLRATIKYFKFSTNACCQLLLNCMLQHISLDTFAKK